MRRFENLKEEFPDYDLTTLPKIPENWLDISWRQEMCPCFRVNPHFRVCIDYLDAKKREHQGPRFLIICDDDPTKDFETSSWQALLNYLFRLNLKRS